MPTDKNFNKVCIYCKQDNKQFSTEHVLPRSFGVFENAMTIQGVCRECNERFGRELDLVLARDSLEGLMRSQYPEIKRKPESFKNLRIKFRIPSQELDGLYEETDGFYVDYDLHTKIWTILPQIFIRNDKTREFEVFFEKDFGDKSKCTHIKKLGNDIKVIAPSQKSFKGLKSLLQNLKKDYNRKPEPMDFALKDEKVTFIIEGIIDFQLSRAFAKIALNYLAYNFGPEFALQNYFNKTRNFINGEGQISPFEVIRPVEEPILADETKELRWFDGHLIILDNTFRAYPNAIIARLSLFNTATYNIFLSLKPLRVWRKIHIGHAFSVSKQKIMPLTAISKSLVPNFIPFLIQRELSLIKGRQKYEL